MQPEMSAPEVTQRLISAIHSAKYDVIICNYANGDMVGHTGNFNAAMRAIEILDACIGELCDAIEQTGGQMLITADHGNCEQMLDPNSQQAHTAHTHNVVPLIYVGPQQVSLLSDGTLSDVAPTLLDLMHLEIPSEMTGRSLASIEALQTA
jgi:2,3-bisphosphoglycerate-independent phosphoglycerate mutase